MGIQDWSNGEGEWRRRGLRQGVGGNEREGEAKGIAARERGRQRALTPGEVCMHRRPRAYGTIVRSVFTAKRRSLVEGNKCKRDLRTTEIIAKVDGHYHGITDHGFSLRNLRPFSRPAVRDPVWLQKILQTIPFKLRI